MDHLQIALLVFNSIRLLRGFQKGRNTAIGPFSRRNSEVLYILWWITAIGILVDTEIFILTDIERIF